MDDLRKLYKQKSYVINPLVLKNIKSLDLSLNEFLLIIYFLNGELSLDLEKIKEALNLTDEEILNTYSNLLTKGYIETTLNKENGKVTEIISLDMLYDKLILTSQKENKTEQTDIFSQFENEFARSLSPIEYETINKWIEKNVSEEIILSALKEAVMCGATNLRYIDKIIYDWTKKGNIKDYEEDYKEIPDIDWLEAMRNERERLHN